MTSTGAAFDPGVGLCRHDRDLLYEIFEPEPAGDASFGLTESGIWHPTPLDVLLPALQGAVDAGWFGSG